MFICNVFILLLIIKTFFQDMLVRQFSPIHRLISKTTFYFFLYSMQEGIIGIVKKFQFPVFNGFTHFGMFWTRFHYFYKMSVSLSVFVCDTNFVTMLEQKLMGRIEWNFIFSCILTLNLQLHLISSWLDFGAYRSRSSTVVQNFWLF